MKFISLKAENYLKKRIDYVKKNHFEFYLIVFYLPLIFAPLKWYLIDALSYWDINIDSVFECCLTFVFWFFFSRFLFRFESEKRKKIIEIHKSKAVIRNPFLYISLTLGIILLHYYFFIPFLVELVSKHKGVHSIFSFLLVSLIFLMLSKKTINIKRGSEK